MEQKSPLFKRKRVAIIGGGISGLSFAFYLLDTSKRLGMNIDLTLVERKDKLGGAFKSIEFEGTIIDLGPEGFTTNGPWVLDLANELGLGSKILIKPKTHTFIATQSRFSKIPPGLLGGPLRFIDLAKCDLFSLPGKIRMALEPFVVKRELLTDESVADFYRRRFGNELLNNLAEPILNGLYGSGLDTLSAHFTEPYMTDLEREFGSVFKVIHRPRFEKVRTRSRHLSMVSHDRAFATFEPGMIVLAEALEGYLRGKCKIIRAEADAVIPMDSGASWKIHLFDQESIEADAVVIAVPARRAGNLLQKTDQWLSSQLKAVNYYSPIIIGLVFDKKPESSSSLGAGFFVSREIREVVGACTFNSNKFNRCRHNGRFVVRVSVGASSFNSNDEVLMRAVVEDLKRFVNFQGAPLYSAIERHEDAIPQFFTRHGHLLKEIELRANRFSNLILIGNAYGAFGVEDCIKRAKEASLRLLKELT